MTISPESFLVLEKSFTTRLKKNWGKSSKAIIKALLKDFVAEDFAGIEKTIAKINLSKALKGDTAYAKVMGTQAAYFGVSRLGNPKDSKTFKNKLIGGWATKATKQTGLILADASKLVRRRVRIVIAKEFEIRSETTGITKAEVIPEFVSAIGATVSAQPTLQLAASLHTSKMASMGFLVEAIAIGKTSYMWNAMLDVRTCPICTHLDKRIFKVKTTYNRMSKVLEATSITDLKRLAPWASQTKNGIAAFTAMSTEEIVQNHYDAPPAHPLPVAEDTEFLAETGWKFVKDAVIGEKAFSLNPITGYVEWVPVIEVIAAGKAPYGRMVAFKSQNADLLVTENHRQVYLSRKRVGEPSRKIKTAGDLLALAQVTIPRSGKWLGKSSGRSEDWLKFLAWWISDGSCTRRGKNSYQIMVSTHKYDKDACNVLERLTGNPAYIEGCNVRCNAKPLGDYLLSNVGSKFDNKKIPMEIMQATKEEILIFLEAYLVGNGHKRVSVGTYGTSVRRVFYTGNSVLAAQLGELIVKVGGYPSYQYQVNTESVIDGRKLNSKATIYRITWCISKTVTFGKNGKGSMGFVSYDKNTYCLTLKTNHIFYARRNGKCIWTGNCRCYIDFVEEPTKIVDYGKFPISNIRGVGLNALISDGEAAQVRDFIIDDLE